MKGGGLQRREGGSDSTLFLTPSPAPVLISYYVPGMWLHYDILKVKVLVIQL